ncbi:MAG: hypothetical protein ACFFCX_03040 [Candidatus Sifarchaeia archaeon]
MGFAWYKKLKGVVTGFLLMFLIFLLINSPMYAAALESNEPHQPDALWIEPSTTAARTAGEKFNLTVWLNISKECFAWQLKILFNSAQFNVSQLGYTDGEKSEFFSSHQTITITPIINYSQGYLIVGETLLENDTRSSGYGSLIWIEFELNSPVTSGQFDFSFSAPYGVDTFVLDPYLDTITLDHVDGAAISITQTLLDDFLGVLIVVVIIIAILTLVIIGITKRKRRTIVDE